MRIPLPDHVSVLTDVPSPAVWQSRTLLAYILIYIHFSMLVILCNKYITFVACASFYLTMFLFSNHLSGDPQRYDSRGVVRMTPSIRPFRDQRLEAPLEEIETEGERQLKALVKRQLEKNVTIEGWELFVYV